MATEYNYPHGEKILATKGIFNLAKRDIKRTNYQKVNPSKSKGVMGHKFLGAQMINDWKKNTKGNSGFSFSVVRLNTSL